MNLERTRLLEMNQDDGEKKEQEHLLGEEEFTLESAIDAIGFGAFQVKLMMITGLSWMADAMEMLLLSILSAELRCLWFLSTVQIALITTAVFFGMTLGAATFGWIADRYGRKKSLYLSLFWVSIFGILSSQAPFYAWILLMRFLVGFGIGGNAQAVTIVTELLPKNSRGRAIIILEFFFAAGSLFNSLLAVVTMKSLGWRWLLGLSTVPSLLFLIVGVWLPESPRYLLTAGKSKEALQVLKRIACENRAEIPRGKLTATVVQEERGEISQLFAENWRKITLMLLLLWFTVGFAYYGIVLLNTEVFQRGLSSCDPYGTQEQSFSCQCSRLKTKDYISLTCIAVSEFPSILITLLTIEYLGRRKTMVIEFAIASAFFLLLFLCTSRHVTVISMFAVRAFVSGVFQTLFVYTPEVFPTTVRSTGLGSCSAFARVGGMLTPFVAQVLLSSSFYAAVGTYVALLAICAVIAGLLPIETKGRELKDTTAFGITRDEHNEYESIR